MKTLLLLRHAQAEKARPPLSDKERALTEQGRIESAWVGDQLKANGWVPDGIIASSARRVKETVDQAQQTSGFSGKVIWEDSLFSGRLLDYLRILRSAPDTFHSLLLAGHNPVLEELIDLLGKQSLNIPPAGLIKISLPISSWTELTEHSSGTIDAFLVKGQ